MAVRAETMCAPLRKSDASGLREFQELMVEHGVDDPDAQHALAGELHELGETVQ